MKFDLLYVDPPWQYANWSEAKNGASKAHYEGMSIEELSSLPVSDVAKRDAVCLLWVTNPKMLEGSHTDLLTSWGFRPACVLFSWVKTIRQHFNVPLDSRAKREATKRFLDEMGIPVAALKGVKNFHFLPGNFAHGNGFYTAGGTELAILGVRGKVKKKPLVEKQILVSPRGKHSAKPNEEVRRRLSRLFPDYDSWNKLELFAREIPDGWSALGDEIDGRDIRDSLPELIEQETRDVVDGVPQIGGGHDF